MQKSILAFLSLSTVLLLSCSVLGKYSEVEYHNLIIDPVNETSLAIENTATLYNQTIPDVVTEQSSIETSEMQKTYDEALAAWETTEDLLTIEAKNLEQQNAVRTELETYRSAADVYLQSYEAMLTYYESNTYQTDLSQVESLDEQLHSNYTTFIEANNDLVDLMETYIQAKE